LPDLALFLFGAPRLEQGGASVPLGRRKSMALLSYLAVTRSRYRRDSLAALLWPDSSQGAAYSALRNVLWILRQTPVSALLHTSRSVVELARENGLWVDANAFRDLVSDCPGRSHSSIEVCPECAPRLEQAIALARAPFMEGFSTLNSPGFDDWQLSEAVALRRELTETLDRLAAYYADREEWPNAVTHARRWVQVDPLDECGHRRLMAALMAQGKRTEALTSFEECARALHAELDLQPEAETVALAEQIRASGGSKRRAKKPPRTNLNAGLLPMIGRKPEMARVRNLLVEQKSRLVTLVGLGGAGKTHLALHIGRELLDRFEDGVFLVSLDSLNGSGYVTTEIARAVGVSVPREEPSSLPAELTDRLKEKRLLLILDGAEVLKPRAGLLTDLLDAAEGVSLLATSREPLEIRGETLIPIGGLAMPDVNASTETSREAEAIRLLRTTSHRVRGSSEPEAGEDDVEAMVSIAGLVDGLPLGLEIAAGWSRILAWGEIESRMSEAVDLPHRRQDVPERHRSLRTVYEQTWGMLSSKEKRTLRRLAAFRDGFSIDAAEAVAGADPAVLAGLTNRCLIRRIEPDRYEIHELLRQYSHERLEADEADACEARTAHSEFFTSRVEALYEEIKGAEQIAALRRFRKDIVNIRIAWCHAAAHGRIDLLERVTEGLFFYYDVCAFFEEGRQAFVETLSVLSERSSMPAVVGLMKTCYGWFALHISHGRGMEWIQEGIDVADAAKPFSSQHALTHVIAFYAQLWSDGMEAKGRLEKSLAFYRETGHRWGESLALTAYAWLSEHEEPRQAESYMLESLRISEEACDFWGQALTLNSLASLAERRGDLGLARVRYQQSRRLASRVAPDSYTAIDPLISQGRVAAGLGESDEAGVLVEEALRLARQTGISVLIARALMQRGRLASGRGDTEAAKRDLLESLTLHRGRSRSLEAAACSVALGDNAAVEGDDASAEGWYQEALALEPNYPPAIERLQKLARGDG